MGVMNDTTQSNQTVPIVKKPHLDCQDASTWKSFQVLLFLVPIVIIAIMQIYSRIKKGKFTAQPPFMFLQDNDRNRLLTIVTFGFLSQQIVEIMFNHGIAANQACRNIDGPEKSICTFFFATFLSAITSIVSYPIFLCISSPYLLVTSIAGIVFIIWEFIKTGLLLYTQCDCKNVNTYWNAQFSIYHNATDDIINALLTSAGNGQNEFGDLHQYKLFVKQQSLDQCNEEEGSRTNLSVAILFPSFIFLVVILYGFGKRLVFCLKTKRYELPEREKSVVESHQILHVQNLIKIRYPEQKPSTLKRLTTIFKPWYRFPTDIWQCLLVIAIVLYTAIAHIQQMVNASFKQKQNSENLKGLKIQNGDSLSTSILKGSFQADPEGIWYSTLALTIILYIIVVVHFLYCVQKDALSIYKGRHVLYEPNDRNHNASLYDHMVFPAYFISSMVVGFFTCFIVVAILVLVFYGIVHEPIIVWKVLRFLLTLFAFKIIFEWIQRLCIRYYLADLEMSKLQINIKHPRLFYVLKFFLLFVNIISSIASLFKRLAFIILNFLIFYGRMDRNPLMFFRNWDISKTYAAFLRVENVFKNPTMRCFCQILLEPHIAHVSGLTTQEQTRDCWGIPLTNETTALPFQEVLRSRPDMVARNRWFLAYTLMKNPGLIRIRSYTKHPYESESQNSKVIVKVI